MQDVQQKCQEIANRLLEGVYVPPPPTLDMACRLVSNAHQAVDLTLGMILLYGGKLKTVLHRSKVKLSLYRLR